jgi:hypothetical protein
MRLRQFYIAAQMVASVTAFTRFTRVRSEATALKSNLVEHVSSKQATQLCELRSDNKLLVT